jgi:lipopolysaccharide transport protein LptA
VVQERSGGLSSRDRGDADVERILDLYRRSGWGGASARVTIAERPDKRVDLRFMIYEGVRSQAPDDRTGPISVTADRVNRDDQHHRTTFTGDVRLSQGDRRVASDRLDLWSYAADDAARSGDGVKEARWEGHVVVDSGHDAASADEAVFDAGSRTLTLSGHVAVERGPWVVRNDRLVIDAQDWWRRWP